WGWLSIPLIGMFGSSAALLFVLYRWIRWRTKRKQEPFLNMQLFAKPAVSVGMYIGFATFVAVFSTQVTLPFYLLGVRHFSPTEAGIMIMAYPVALGIMGPISGSLSDRHGSSNITLLGLGCMSAAL
ncbi:MFS transporter, partial [Acinetobacter baumannii]|uniref:MFS transporter n=1 Tax=Acinetobacter baumannii TaxID=470 RepID=UPI000AF6E9E0